MQLTPGATLQGGKYRIEKALGQGSFGITYLASMQVEVEADLGHIQSTVYVAVKEFFMHEINGREGSTVTCSSRNGLYDKYKTKFAREVHNLSRLRHPHIVRVLALFEENNTVYYAMEFLNGGSLDDCIRRRQTLPEAEALGYIRQIGSALSYMHAHKMLHFDLKPSNIMLHAENTAILIDFGLSKQYDDAGQPESSTTIGGGTPGYAPLEQSDYREGRDFPVTMDVYALGGTLFKMLTGKQPPKASALLNEGFPAHELQERGVSDDVIACVAKAMAPMKAQRYQSVEAFVGALEAAGRSAAKADLPKEETELEETIRITVLQDPGKQRRSAGSGGDSGEGAGQTTGSTSEQTAGSTSGQTAGSRSEQKSGSRSEPTLRTGFWASLRQDWSQRPMVLNIVLTILFAISSGFSFFLILAALFNEEPDLLTIGGCLLYVAWSFYEMLRNRRSGLVLCCAAVTTLIVTLVGMLELDNEVTFVLVLGSELLIGMLLGLFFIRRNGRSMWHLMGEKLRNREPRKTTFGRVCGIILRTLLTILATIYLAVHGELRIMAMSGADSDTMAAIVTVAAFLGLSLYFVLLCRRREKRRILRWIPLFAGLLFAWIYLGEYYGHRYHDDYIECRHGRGLANVLGFPIDRSTDIDYYCHIHYRKESRNVLLGLDRRYDNGQYKYYVYIYPSRYGGRGFSYVESFSSAKTGYGLAEEIETRYGSIYYKYGWW